MVDRVITLGCGVCGGCGGYRAGDHNLYIVNTYAQVDDR